MERIQTFDEVFESFMATCFLKEMEAEDHIRGLLKSVFLAGFCVPLAAYRDSVEQLTPESATQLGQYLIDQFDGWFKDIDAYMSQVETREAPELITRQVIEKGPNLNDH
jgi:hypothetical protein